MKNKPLFAFTLLILGLFACREPYHVTGEDYSDYGWTFYQNGEYTEAQTWFETAIEEDPFYVDGFNGAGWSTGKQADLTQAISYFSQGIAVGDTTEYFNELVAGRAFSRHAAANYQQAITDGISVLARDSVWVFSQDPRIDHSDLKVTVAASYFAVADFAKSLLYVQQLDPAFTADVTVSSGISQLSHKIELLRLGN